MRTGPTGSGRSSPVRIRGATTATPGGRRTSTFSIFGTAFTQRLVTQMYFPSDPLFDLDPIYQSITDPKAREALVATYDHDLTIPDQSMGYRWDVVLSGSGRTWMEDGQ